MRVRIEKTVTRVLDVEVPDNFTKWEITNETANAIVSEVTEWAEQHGQGYADVSGNTHITVYNKGARNGPRYEL